MPWYTFKEIWTPLKIVGIRFYRRMEDEILFVKMGKGPRRPFLTRFN